MTRVDFVAAIVLLLGCERIETEGLQTIGPNVWSAIVECDGEARLLGRGEVAEVSDGWQCVSVDPEKYMGWIRCWRGDSEFTLAAACEPGFYRSMAYLDGCRVEITCEGRTL
jgi:hypothetical protein